MDENKIEDSKQQQPSITSVRAIAGAEQARRTRRSRDWFAVLGLCLCVGSAACGGELVGVDNGVGSEAQAEDVSTTRSELTALPGGPASPATTAGVVASEPQLTDDGGKEKKKKSKQVEQEGEKKEEKK